MISLLLSTPEGLAEFFIHVPPSPQAAQAYAFISSIAKDHSVLGASISLTKAAMAIDTKPNHYLNLAHIYETINDLPAALTTCLDFLSTNKRGINSCLSYVVPVCINLLAASMELSHDSPCTEYVVWESNERALVRNISSTSGENESRKALNRLEFDSDALDIMAIFFTVVKILYHQGKFGCLPSFIREVERARMASIIPLHNTFIRNEHAYYLCVVQVLAARAVLASPNAALSFDPYHPQMYSLASQSPIYVGKSS